MEYTSPLSGRTIKVMESEFSRDPWKLVQCEETGFVFLANPPEYSQLENELAWERTYLEERARREREEPLVSNLSLMLKKVKWTLFPNRNKIASMACWAADRLPSVTPLRILDVGCGWGDLLVEMHQRLSRSGRSIELCGIEVSKQLAEVSESKVKPLNGTILSCNAIDGLSQIPERSLSLTLMCSFLEHEAQPLPLLTQVHRALREDGLVVLKVPNFACWNRRVRRNRWCGFRYPDHINYFTPATLRILAHHAGFYVLRQTLFDRSPFNDSMYAVLAKS